MNQPRYYGRCRLRSPPFKSRAREPHHPRQTAQTFLGSRIFSENTPVPPESGPIGDHGITILLAPGEPDLEADLRSDTRSVLPLGQALAREAGPGIRWIRDPTRGGVATSLNQLARDCGLGIVIAAEATDTNDWTLDCVLPPAGYKPVPAVSLAMEPANLTAVANDVGVQVIFLRQLIAQPKPEDVAIGISTSGGSRNIIVALEEARRPGLMTAALLGYDGGKVLRRGLADFPVVVRSDYIPRIQEVQASIYHVIRELFEVLERGQV